MSLFFKLSYFVCTQCTMSGVKKILTCSMSSKLLIYIRICSLFKELYIPDNPNSVTI